MSTTKTKIKLFTVILLAAVMLLSAAGLSMLPRGAGETETAQAAGVWDGSTRDTNWLALNPASPGTAGTSSNPYIIDTPEKLAGLLNTTAATSNNKFWRITEDLDLGGRAWPSGTTQFLGTLDGYNHTIYNLSANGVNNGSFLYCAAAIKNLVFDGIVSNSWIGLVRWNANHNGAINEAYNASLEINNVVIKNAELVAGNSVQYAGFFAGNIYTRRFNGDIHVDASFSIENCKVINSSLSATKGGDYGGLVGRLEIAETQNPVTIRNNSVAGTEITLVHNGDYVAAGEPNFSGLGGMIGNIIVTIELTAFNFTFENNTLSSSTVSGKNGINMEIGGMIGTIANTPGTSGNNRSQKLAIVNCHVGGAVESLGQHNELNFVEGWVGGIVGAYLANGWMALDRCTNSARITGGKNTGGLVGRVTWGRLDLLSCYNRGNIIIPSVQRISGSTAIDVFGYGGLVGYAETGPLNVSACANFGGLLLQQVTYVQGAVRMGGLFGYLLVSTANLGDSQIFDCYSTGTVNSTVNAAGQKLEPLVGEALSSKSPSTLLNLNTLFTFNWVHYTHEAYQSSSSNGAALTTVNRPSSYNIVYDSDFTITSAELGFQIFYTLGSWSWHGGGGFTVPAGVHSYIAADDRTSYPTLGAAAADGGSFNMVKSDSLSEAVVTDKAVKINTGATGGTGYILGGTVTHDTPAVKLVEHKAGGSLAVAGSGSVTLETPAITLDGMVRAGDGMDAYQELKLFARQGKTVTIKVIGQNALVNNYETVLTVYGDGETIIEGGGSLSLACSAGDSVSSFRGNLIIRNVTLRFDHITYGRAYDAIGIVSGDRVVIEGATVDFQGYTVTGPLYGNVSVLRPSTYYPGCITFYGAGPSAELVFVKGSSISVRMRSTATGNGGACVKSYRTNTVVNMYGASVTAGAWNLATYDIGSKATSDTIAGYTRYMEREAGTGVQAANGKWYTSDFISVSQSALYGNNVSVPSAPSNYIANTDGMNKSLIAVNEDYTDWLPLEFYYDLQEPLTGTLRIRNSNSGEDWITEQNPARYNQSLNVIFSGGNNTGTLTIRWWVDDVMAQQSQNNNYNVKESDIGKVIKAEILSNVQSGSVFSDATPPVAKRLGANAPSAPTKASATETSITLESTEGYEYRLSSGAWQPSNVFTGLSAGQSYTFYQRIAETSTHLPSAESPAAQISTNAPDITAPALSAGSAIRTSDTRAVIGFTSSEDGTAYYLVQASGTAPPTGAAVKAGTLIGEVYAAANEDIEVTLTAGVKDIYVVVEDAAGNISTPFKIVAAAFVPPYSISISETGTYDFPGATVGYGTQGSLTITVTNNGSLPTGALTISKFGGDSAHFTLSKTTITDIASGGFDTFTVTPNTGLSAKKYTTYLSIKNANIDEEDFLVVSFTVSAETTPPTVVSVTPSGTGSAISGNVVITFSEAMNPAAAGTVQLNNLTALSGGSWSNGNTVYTIAYSGLSYSTSYTVNISDFEDVAGNTMTANGSNSFTTAAVVNAVQPVIDVQPAGATYLQGETASALTVSARSLDGGTLSYKWYRRTTPDGTASAISGADSATYVPPTSTVGTRYYYCVVTNSISDNGDGGYKSLAITSAIVTITVEALTYGISLDPSADKTFSGVYPGYGAQTPYAVTINSTGNSPTGALSIALSGANAGSFTLSKVFVTDIAAGGSDSFTVVPNMGLGVGTYTATVTVSGGTNITAQSFSVSFTVYPAPDTTPPTVTTVTPSGTGAAIGGNVVITFSETMNASAPGAVRLNNIALSGGSWSNNNTVFTIAYSGLAYSTAYTVNISDFKDVAGNTMTADGGNGFTTMAAPDTTKPTVISVTPNSTEIRTPVSGYVVITFSEAMDTATAGTVRFGLIVLSGGTWSNGNTVFTIPYSNLSAGTIYQINISGFKDIAGNVMDLDDSAVFYTEADVLTGTVTINGYTGAPKVGDTLTASVTSNNSGSLSYVWKVDGVQVGTGTGIVVSVDDLGKTITLEIKSSVETGTLTAGPTSKVIKKDAPDAPGAPTFVSKSYNSIIVETVSGYLYFISEGVDWQASGEFHGLQAGKQYYIYRKIAETADTYESPDSEPLIVTTDAAPVGALTGTAAISNNNPRIGDTLTASLNGGNNTGVLSYQWKAGGENVGTNSNTYTVRLADLGKIISVEITSSVQTGSVSSNATVAVQKKAAPAAAPTPTAASKTPSSVTLTANPLYEYKMGNGEWQSSNVFEGLSPETAYTFYQRVKETEDTLPGASSSGAVIITDAAPIVTYTVTVTGGTGGDNYAAGDTVTITAGTAPAGQIFDRWTSQDGVTFLDAESVSTTFTMLAKAVTVTATYKNIPPVIYSVSVTGGTADISSGETGTTVTLTVGTPPGGKRFKEWRVVSGGVTVTGNTFTIGTANVVIEAVWEDIPVTPIIYTVSVTDGTANPASGEAGTVVTLTVGTAPSGKQFKEWRVVSGGVTVTSNTFTIGTADVVIEAVWEDIPVTPTVYTISVTGGTANPDSGETGTVVTLTVGAAPSGNQFKEWRVVSGGVTVAGNTFTIGTANVVIEAVWEDIPGDGDNDGLSGGAIAGIVGGSVVLLGAAGFCVYWFIIRKKKKI